MARASSTRSTVPSTGFFAAVRRHRVPVIVVVALLAVVAVVVSVAGEARVENNRRGLDALFTESDRLLRENRSPADWAVAYKDIADRHPDAPEAQSQALLFEFRAHRMAENRDAAIVTARRFLERFPRHAFAPDLRLALAKLLTTPERVEEARKEFALLRASSPARIAPDVELLAGQIELADAWRNRDNPERHKTLLDAANTAFDRCIQMADAQNWPRTIHIVASFHKEWVQDRQAGHIPERLAPEATLPPFPPAIDDDDDHDDHDGHDHATPAAPSGDAPAQPAPETPAVPDAPAQPTPETPAAPTPAANE